MNDEKITAEDLRKIRAAIHDYLNPKSFEDAKYRADKYFMRTNPAIITGVLDHVDVQWEVIAAAKEYYEAHHLARLYCSAAQFDRKLLEEVHGIQNKEDVIRRSFKADKKLGEYLNNLTGVIPTPDPVPSDPVPSDAASARKSSPGVTPGEE